MTQWLYVENFVGQVDIRRMLKKHESEENFISQSCQKNTNNKFMREYIRYESRSSNLYQIVKKKLYTARGIYELQIEREQSILIKVY